MDRALTLKSPNHSPLGISTCGTEYTHQWEVRLGLFIKKGPRHEDSGVYDRRADKAKLF